ncbi:hypothetical protein P154DRAFT_481696 [Amniculicola lignicola CBS 123094]|uniref:Zn(2)-C6 fungal-type domain-containing protein n=1 Tax=Amniculicola lignicola CBS 123094 TaxID=1392246 RepID=A0A6A5WYK3_9PLEO|nr:hypothetical protein P154DRAFT_481696 [Amniculicola lignicola CBS 123094]
MEYDALPRFSQTSSFASPHYYADRNAPLAISYMVRPGADHRSCPMSGGPPGTPVRKSGGNGQDDGTADAGMRKRIAVACARCRKRKIRCSGDPGDQSGCQNCRQAGVETAQCQFHRVGAQDVQSLTAAGFGNGILGMPHMVNQMMPMYHAASSPMYSRGVPAGHIQYHGLNPKTAMQNWTVSYPEDSSPVDAYGIDQTGAYLSNPNAMPQVYGDNYRWHQTEPKAPHSGLIYGQEASVPASYAAHGLPCINTSSLRGVAATEPVSPLNMTALQSTLPISLPERPHSRQVHVPVTDATAPQRRLPAPQPSPAQTSRNAVDQLQDQRLRTAPMLASCVKPAIAWNTSFNINAAGIQSSSSSDTSSSDLVPTPVSVSSGSDGGMGYLPVTTSSSLSDVPTEPTATSSGSNQQPALNFTTTNLLDAMPAPPNQSTYSNFRDYNLPTSSSTEPLAVLARPPSHNSLYSYAKRSSLGELATEATLVSGQRYAPLDRPVPQHSASIEGLKGETFERSGVPVHRASMGNLNRGY